MCKMLMRRLLLGLHFDWPGLLLKKLENYKNMFCPQSGYAGNFHEVIEIADWFT